MYRSASPSLKGEHESHDDRMKYLGEFLQGVENKRDRPFIAECVVGGVIRANGSHYSLYFQVFTVDTPNL